MVEQCDGMSMASSGTGLLVFSDDVTEDRSSRMNSEVYRDILSAKIQSNAAKLKSAAVKAWQSITKEETQSLVMSMSSRLKAVIACKGFSTKY